MKIVFRRPVFVLAFTLLVAGAGAWLIHGKFAVPEATGPRFAPPTEHRLDSDAERLNRKGRKEWIRAMHLAEPGTDWRAIERQNGLALMALRDQMPSGGGRDEGGWLELGSRDLSGRMHCAAISLDGDSLYAGSDLGGLWKADLWGNGWRPLSDNLYGGVRNGVAVAGVDPEIVTVLSSSEIIRYSDDMGDSWQLPAGLPAGLQQATRIVRDPADADRLYLLTLSAGVSMQLYRSDDAGRSYTLARALGMPRGDFWIDRVSGNELYLLIGNTLHRSSDQGDNWQELGAIPTSYTASEVILAGSEAGGPTFYAAAKVLGEWELWRSRDGGWTWEHRWDIGDFWETLNCSITDPDLVLFAGVEAWRSTDGGASFIKVNGWGEYYGDPLNKLHADNPGLECIWLPGTGEIFFPCTDGGIYRSTDGMASVLNLSLDGLGVSQYYDIHTSVNDPNLLLGGSQDQGYQRSTGPAGGGTWPFEQLISGDYGHLTSSDGGHTIVFSVYPGFTLVQHGEISPSLHYLDFPGGSNHLWLPPIVADPEDGQAFYFCGQYLYRGRWTGGNNVAWTNHPQNFTTAGGSYLSALAISPVNGDYRYAVTNSGALWYSHDHGATWQPSPDQGPSAHYFYGNALASSQEDAQSVWVGGSGYSGPAVYHSEDGGLSWTPTSDGLPSTLVYGLACDDSGLGWVYAATEAGPYAYDPTVETWSYIGGDSVPFTLFWCVEWVPAIAKARFGTYGRGIWEYTPGTLTVAAEDTSPTPGLTLASYPNPFNPRCTIAFHQDQDAEFRLRIFDATGRCVRLLAEGRQSAGARLVDWDGRDTQGADCTSGVYFARLEAGAQVESIRLTLLR